MSTKQKPVIGITCGDVNGIGPELIIKTFADSRIIEMCTPVIFASNKVINFYRKTIADINFNFFYTKEFDRINPKQVNILNVWDEDVNITPGGLNEIGGNYAVQSLEAAVAALKAGQVQGLVTAPFHKSNVQSERFAFTGHTPYLRHMFEGREAVMMMCASNMRVALVTEHVPVSEVARYITQEAIFGKLQTIHASLQRDFNIEKPRIAVLGLNPHAGDEGLVGQEEQNIIKPAIRQAKDNNIMAYGPYSADAFFARAQYGSFDAVLAMYHDQGLIPFKSLALGEGVNFTAGLDIVRTSPDHGTAFDIAGKGRANHHSFAESLYYCIDILSRRMDYDEARANPMKKRMPEVTAKLADERIED